jgi:hypothetical protein
MPHTKNHKVELANNAIQKVVALFCSRCAAAVDALEADNIDKFDEYFQLQRMAWVNLDSMITKYEKELVSGSEARQMIRAWMIPCQQAAASLQAKMGVKLAELEGQGSKSGRLRIRLAAFQSAQSAIREPGLFAKGA